MTKANRIIKRVAIGLFSFLLIGVAVVAFLLYGRFNPLPWDEPNELSGVIDTIEVWDILVACDCAEWGIVGEERPEENSIFIEAAPGVENYRSAKLPENCWASHLQLIGQFYIDKGISRDYSIIFEKPGAARVFRYDSYVVTNYRCSPEDVEEYTEK